MLVVTLQVRTDNEPFIAKGTIYNVSNRARVSDYRFAIAGRLALQEAATLHGYPRWSESSAALLARCLALTRADVLSADPGDGWRELAVRLEVHQVRSGRSHPVCTVSASRPQAGVMDVGMFQDEVGTPSQVLGVPLRAGYGDVWAVAEHALRVACFGSDELPPPQPLAPEVRTYRRQRYICVDELPQPVQSVFLRRIAGASVPVIPGRQLCAYLDDWEDFLDGPRRMSPATARMLADFFNDPWKAKREI